MPHCVKFNTLCQNGEVVEKKAAYGENRGQLDTAASVQFTGHSLKTKHFAVWSPFCNWVSVPKFSQPATQSLTVITVGQAVYAAQGIVLSRLYDDALCNALRRVLYRLDQRMYEISPRTSPRPNTRNGLCLNELVYGVEVAK